MVYHKPELDEKKLNDLEQKGKINPVIFRLVKHETAIVIIIFSIPFGVGVKYSFSKHIAASIEWGMRKTWSDYLDDVSTTYYLNSSDFDPTEFAL